jgi:hypothetical protein
MIPYLIAGGIILIAGVLLSRLKIKNPEFSPIAKEYHKIYTLIQNAPTKSELAALEEMADQFEAEHKSHAWVSDMYTDLLSEINLRYHILSARSLQTKAQ